MHIFRENTEDIYAGIEWQAGTPEAEKFLKFLTEQMGVTKVRFPERFSEKCREVEVCGEAFFEVAKDKHVPFIVKTGAYEITVLGTKFNVTAYADEHVITTTLVEGAVSISGKCIGEARTLRPNEQLVLDQTSGGVGVRKVDVNYYTAWKDGYFIFRYSTLREVMQQLSRWYDFEYEVPDMLLDKYHFSGEFKRFDNLDRVLEIIRSTGIPFVLDIKNGKVIIRKEA